MSDVWIKFIGRCLQKQMVKFSLYLMSYDSTGQILIFIHCCVWGSRYDFYLVLFLIFILLHAHIVRS